MKVKDLKKILGQYPDNMDVFAHNGFVDDFQDIAIDEDVLCKHKPSHLFKLINLQRKERGVEPIKNLKGCKTKWEYLNEFSDSFPKEHVVKKILLIQLKKKGKVVHDRLGAIEY
jgi:hypothetical protein